MIPSDTQVLLTQHVNVMQSILLKISSKNSKQNL